MIHTARQLPGYGYAYAQWYRHNLYHIAWGRPRDSEILLKLPKRQLVMWRDGSGRYGDGNGG